MTTNPPSVVQRPTIYRKILIFGGLLCIAAVALRIYPGRPAATSMLPRLALVPAFSLTERGGNTISNNQLFGKIWVADFIYTTCPGPCPLVTATMARLQKDVAHDANVQLVTFTVDPTNDTPAVLAAYADKFGADKNRWWFLTGPEKQVYALISEGFHLAVQDEHGNAKDGAFTVTHSTKLALVDTNGVVRGYFDGVGPEGRVELLKALAILEKEKS